MQQMSAGGRRPADCGGRQSSTHLPQARRSSTDSTAQDLQKKLLGCEAKERTEGNVSRRLNSPHSDRTESSSNYSKPSDPDDERVDGTPCSLRATASRSIAFAA
jgi:hypothetical protein